MSGRLIATVVVVVATAVLVGVSGAIANRRGSDEFSSYYYRQIARYLSILAGIIALVVVWRSTIGHLALFGGLVVAGLAFAMQEAIGSVAGWLNGHRLRRLRSRFLTSSRSSESTTTPSRNAIAVTCR